VSIRGVTIDPASIGALIGVLASMLQTWRRRHEIAAIREEVKPNGGASMRDAVDRTRNAVDRIERGLAELTGTVDANRERIETIETLHQRQRHTWRRR
jgi:hypothetical protein